MKTNSPETGETTGDNKLATIPTGMEHDPKADEQVIDQQTGQQTSEAVQHADDPADADELANSIAYALDGSGPGPSNSPGPSSPGPSSRVNGEAHKVITEGVTGAGPEDEEDAAREWRSL